MRQFLSFENAYKQIKDQYGIKEMENAIMLKKLYDYMISNGLTNAYGTIIIPDEENADCKCALQIKDNDEKIGRKVILTYDSDTKKCRLDGYNNDDLLISIMYYGELFDLSHPITKRLIGKIKTDKTRYLMI